MVGYRVDVFVLKVIENDHRERESFDYKHTNEDIQLIQLRNEAIEKAKDLISFFENELHDTRLLSISKAEITKMNDYSSYSLQIFFYHDGTECAIYGGEINEIFDCLTSEANYYKRTMENAEMTIITTPTGEEIEVIKSNIEFFCSTDD